MISSIEKLVEDLKYIDVSRLSPSDCARMLRRVVECSRENSFYSKEQQKMSVLRFQRLFKELNASPASKIHLQQILQMTLRSFDFASLLTQTGLSRPHGFLQEFFARIFDKILPRHSPRPNFKALLFFLFPVSNDSRFFSTLPPDLLDQILILFDPAMATPLAGREYLRETFKEKLLDSLLILSAESLVLSESPHLADIRWTLAESPKKKHSFLELNSFIHKIVETLLNKPTGWKENSLVEIEATLSNLLANCRKDLVEVLNRLEESSLSVDLVYQLEVLHLFIERIYSISKISIFSGRSNQSINVVDFFATLIEEEQRRRSLKALVNQNVHYLARKIVDRAGETGDHYIARNGEENRELFRAALGGGFITAFTTLFKVLIHRITLPLFFEGFINTLNYAGSFIAMQFMHLTLATKQPAMTAAALARKMTTTDADNDGLWDEMKNLLRSQSLAAMGNLCAVAPTAYCLYLAWHLFSDSNYMTVEQAHHLIQAHDPFRSLTVLFALITGVFLWSTSIVHGWVENWMVFRGIPELLTESFLLENFLSAEKRVGLSKWLQRNLSGIVTNTTLGFLLAFAPIMGNFFGIGLEVRHVTLTMGSLTLAWATLPTSELTFSTIALGLTSVVLILICNILTSFALSLWLALRAKGWAWHDVQRVIQTLPKVNKT